MRVLFVLHQFFPEFASGTEQVTLNLAKAMQRLGHYVHVLTCRVGGVTDGIAGLEHTLHCGLSVTAFSHAVLPKGSDSVFAFEDVLMAPLGQFLDAQRFDLCHVTHGMRMMSLFPLLAARDIPYILTLTDFYLACHRINLIDAAGQPCPGPEGGMRCAERCPSLAWDARTLGDRHDTAQAILSQSLVNACPSTTVQRAYQSAFPDLRFTVIPHGINFFDFDRAAAPRPQDGSVVVGFLGTVTPAKGLDVLVRAFVDTPQPELRLHIAGPIGDGEYWAREIEPLVRRDPRIRVLGSVQDGARAGFFRDIDVLALPSRVPESFSLVLSEAQFCGVPIMASDLGAPAERILNGENGRLLPAGNVAAWRAALGQLTDEPDTSRRWRERLPLPYRIEEEAFFYSRLYSALVAG